MCYNLSKKRSDLKPNWGYWGLIINQGVWWRVNCCKNKFCVRSPLKNVRAIEENLPRFWKNVGDFPKNVGVFSAYVARFFQPLLDDAMRSLTKLVIFIKSQSGIWVKQTASPHNNSNAKITKKRPRKSRRKRWCSEHVVEAKKEVPRARIRAHLQQFSTFCFHNLHKILCRTVTFRWLQPY